MSIRNRCTAAVRAGIDSDTAYGAVTPPIVLSSNFSFAGFNEKRKYDYTRSGNPTRDLLAEALAELEGGAGAVITATGMGAITLLLHALLKPGDRLVVPHDGYGGSWRLFNALAKKGAFELITALPGALLMSQRTKILEAFEAVFAAAPFTMIANVTGQPSISLPLHWTDDGLPMGLMFTGARIGDEAVLFQRRNSNAPFRGSIASRRTPYPSRSKSWPTHS